MITKEVLETELVGLKKQFQDLETQALMVQGATQYCEQLLARFSMPIIEKEEAATESVSVENTDAN